MQLDLTFVTQGPQLNQKTVSIRKTVRESLRMRIGGGIGSNEGDTPIYIANIHPHGCIGKSKQLKVRTSTLFFTSFLLVHFNIIFSEEKHQSYLAKRQLSKSQERKKKGNN